MNGGKYIPLLIPYLSKYSLFSQMHAYGAKEKTNRMTVWWSGESATTLSTTAVWAFGWNRIIAVHSVNKSGLYSELVNSHFRVWLIDYMYHMCNRSVSVIYYCVRKFSSEVVLLCIIIVLSPLVYHNWLNYARTYSCTTI